MLKFLQSLTSNNLSVSKKLKYLSESIDIDECQDFIMFP